MHDVFLRLFDGRLIFPPISRPRRILDCGFGEASWAVDVAETHPNCQVRRVGRSCLANKLPSAPLFLCLLPPPVGLTTWSFRSVFSFPRFPGASPWTATSGGVNAKPSYFDCSVRSCSTLSCSRTSIWRRINSWKQVIGIDICIHMAPEDPPQNLEIQVDDLNSR